MGWTLPFREADAHFAAPSILHCREALLRFGAPLGVAVLVEDLLEVGFGLVGHLVADVIVGGGEPALALAVGGLGLGTGGDGGVGLERFVVGLDVVEAGGLGALGDV